MSRKEMTNVITVILWLANFASSDWSIPGPITCATDLSHLLSFVFCFICTLFEMANHFGFDKGSLVLEIRLFHDYENCG